MNKCLYYFCVLLLTNILALQGTIFNDHVTPIFNASDDQIFVGVVTIATRGTFFYGIVYDDYDYVQGGNIYFIDHAGSVQQEYQINALPNKVTPVPDYYYGNTSSLYYALKSGDMVVYDLASRNVSRIKNFVTPQQDLENYTVYDDAIYFQSDDEDDEKGGVRYFNQGKSRLLFHYENLPVSILYIPSQKSVYFVDGFGGSAGVGGIYNVATNGSISMVYSFSGYDGNNPDQAVVSHDEYIYGTSEAGGGQNGGNLWKFDPQSHALTVLYEFAYSKKNSGLDSLVYAADDVLYGVFSGIKPNETTGAIFKYDIKTKTMAYKPNDCSLGTIDSVAAPQGTLMFGLLDITNRGTKVVFALNSTDTFTVIH